MRNVTKSRRTAMAVAAVTAAGMLLAGCATAVSGSAEIGTGQPATAVSAPDTGSTPGTMPSSASSSSASSSSASSSSASSSSASSSSATSDGSSPPATSEGQGTASPPGSSLGPAAGNDPSVYPTKPLQIAKNPSSPQDQALAEARRLAAYIPVPSAIDPQFSEGGNISTLPFKGASALQVLFTDPVPTVAQRAGMYTGFSSARGTVDHSGSLLTAAFVFPDAAAATKAAVSLSAASKSKDDKPLTIPGQPKAVGLVSSTSAQGFLAVGSVVGNVYTSAKAGKTAGFPALVSKTLAAETKSLAAYKPTPKDKLGALLVDPDGLLAQTLPELPGKGSVFDGAWTPKAFLHFMIGYQSSVALFNKIKVDAVASNRSTVYRAANHDGAVELAKTNVAQIATAYPKMKRYATPGHTADTTCVADNLGAKYYCSGAVGRYTFEYWADSEADMAKSVAAQVSLLAS